jgi:hypothetical protein
MYLVGDQLFDEGQIQEEPKFENGELQGFVFGPNRMNVLLIIVALYYFQVNLATTREGISQVQHVPMKQVVFLLTEQEACSHRHRELGAKVIEACEKIEIV